MEICVINEWVAFAMRYLPLILILPILSQQTKPDCPCITGWQSEDLNCDTAMEDGTIELLQDFLTTPSINCFTNCDINFECQQSLSLLTQYYDYCPLGAVDSS